MPPKKAPPKKPLPKKHPLPPPPQEEEDPIDLTPVPIALQQLLLNTLKSALLPSPSEKADLKTHIQTLKSHLFNRDFESAFTDASHELLAAYALRWSATRALGYVGVFRGWLLGLATDAGRTTGDGTRVICVGGGAGAEILALAAAWRDVSAPARADHASLDEDDGDGRKRPGISITAVDIADWSPVVESLSTAIRNPGVPALRSCPAPLLPASAGSSGDGQFEVGFQRADVLSLPDSAFGALFGSGSGAASTLVTLMFTLNELFSTSMAKATGFLLRLTEALRPGTVLLVVDSPGSYSTLRLGPEKERNYPMKFLLDHTLLSVAGGRWERVFSQDSRWWRREAARLSYDVGEGAGLEDMRFQVHVYRRVDG